MPRKTAQEIVMALLDSGDTQVTIQQGTGISQATISRILAGNDPLASTVAKLTDYAERRKRKNPRR